MPQFNFSKFIERINLIGSAGTIKPGDWDTQINICIMQALELQNRLDADKLDLYDLTAKGASITLTDHPSNVDQSLVHMFIAFNDTSTHENRRKLMRLLPKLKNSDDGQSYSQKRIELIENGAKALGFHGEAGLSAPASFLARNFPDEGIRLFAEALDIKPVQPVTPSGLTAA